MKYLKLIALCGCLFVTACATPSMGELAASEPNQAKLSSEQAAVKQYDQQPEDQLRMFIYTEFDKQGRNQKGRDGYFVDFIK